MCNIWRLKRSLKISGLKDGQDPLSFQLAALVPTDVMTAKAIAPFYEKYHGRPREKNHCTGFAL